MIAHFLETVILPRCDAAIDLHSGGKASFFQPCALPTHTDDAALAAKNMELARIFGLPLIWRLGANKDNRSVNSAASRAGIPIIATELGGGGGVHPEITNHTEDGIFNVMRHLGMVDGAVSPAPGQRIVELSDVNSSLFAKSEGLFDRSLSAGHSVSAGDFAGQFHYVTEPERPSINLYFSCGDLILAHTNRGLVKRGEMLFLVVQDAE